MHVYVFAQEKVTATALCQAPCPTHHPAGIGASAAARSAPCSRSPATPPATSPGGPASPAPPRGAGSGTARERG